MKRKYNTPLKHVGCPPPEDIVASVLDDAMDADSGSIRHHLKSCLECQKLLTDTQASVDMLQSVKLGPISRDVTPDVLARIPHNAWRNHTHERGRPVYSFVAWMPLQIATIALLLAGAGALTLHLMHDSPKEQTGHSSTVSAVDRGVGWLLARQTSAGDWNIEELGGRPEYSTALNGLAVLALSRTYNEKSIFRASLERAATFLIGQQAENGRLGKDFDGTMYNHGVATLALLEVYRITQDEQWQDPITKALTFILARQSPAGGWGYLERLNSPPNTSVTAWQIQSLLVADKLGWQENRIAVRKALAWMAGTMNGNGHFGYEGPQQHSETPNTLSMMGAYCTLSALHLDISFDTDFTARVIQGMGTLAGEKPEDYYGAFFFSSALAELSTGTCRDALLAAQVTIAARQQINGKNTGAWLANDRWGSVGGLLYSTSMAMLALTPSHDGVTHPNPTIL